MLRVSCVALGGLLAACSATASPSAGQGGHSTDGLADASAEGDADAGSVVVVPVAVAPEIDAPARPDACAVAAAQGATYCEAGAGTLEYCEAAPEGGVCVELSEPPRWVYELLLACYAECVVTIRTSQRLLSGSCCYIGEGGDVGP